MFRSRLIGGDEPWQYSLADAAKIFTEINTLGEPLKPEMQYLLGRSFRIHGSKPDNDWGPYHDVEIGARVRQRRRANHLSYSLAVELGAAAKGKALHGSIQLREGQANAKARYRIGGWMKFVRKWFSGKNAIYPISTTLSEKDIQLEVAGFFAAIQSTANHNTTARKWTNQKTTKRWQPGRGMKKSFLEQRNQCTSLLELYPKMVEYIIAPLGNDHPRPLKKQEFEQRCMIPLRNVDWCDDELKQLGGSGGQSRRKAFRDWMWDAMRYADRDHLPSISDVLNREIGEIPGAGICSKPSHCGISKVEGFPPNKERCLTISLRAPRNCPSSRKGLVQLRIQAIGDGDTTLWDHSLSIDETTMQFSRNEDSGSHFVEIQLPAELNPRIKKTDWEKLNIRTEWKNEFGTRAFDDAWTRPGD